MKIRESLETIVEAPHTFRDIKLKIINCFVIHHMRQFLNENDFGTKKD